VRIRCSYEVSPQAATLVCRLSRHLHRHRKRPRHRRGNKYPPLSSTRPDPLPSPSESPTPKTLSVSTAVITWKNRYSGLCLNEQEEDVTHDTGALGLWDCNGSTNQMWTEKIIPAHPTSIAKNLVSSRSGKCVTYDPDPDYGTLSVWLAPCGKDGQGWIRTWNDQAYIFQAVELPGLCMSAPNGPVTEGFIGIQLRRCGPPSPLTDWRPR
jgi:Ricin-type beta-trefoil lectin domain